jgi:hypothetical protein
MASKRPRARRVANATAGTPASADRRRAPTSSRRRRPVDAPRIPIPIRNARPRGDVVRVPVLADGADPGKTVPSAMAVRDRLVIDRSLLEDYHPDQLFAYDVTRDNMGFLRGLVSPGDRIVFRRGGRVSEDRICAVRTRDGIVLSRVRFDQHTLTLLPAGSGSAGEPVRLEDVTGSAGLVAGTHVLLIRR